MDAIDLKQIMDKIQELDDLLEENCLYRENCIEIRDYESAELPYPIELSIGTKEEEEE
jgi:hypothetical protein